LNTIKECTQQMSNLMKTTFLNYKERNNKKNWKNIKIILHKTAYSDIMLHYSKEYTLCN
jgi:hypothetical protein